MAIDKALYPAPVGIEDEIEESPIEIEIENPESVTIGMDGMEIEIEPGKDNGDVSFDANLAEHMDEAEFIRRYQKIGSAEYLKQVAEIEQRVQALGFYETP